jgi:predicted phosphodiesterase
MIVGFLADIHEDITNLNLAFEVLAQHQCEKIICLGDIVGFTLPFYQYIQSRDAETCITQIRSRCSVAVAGNHDLYAVRRIPQFKAGFDYDPNWYDLDYTTRAKKARNKIWLYEDNEIPSALSPASLEFLQNLQETELLNLDGMSCLISHFCYPDFSGSSIFFPSQAFHLKKYFQFLEEQGCQIGISGHGHPEGCLIVDEENFTLHPFGSIQLTKEPQWIVAPCVAHTSRANGCMVLDTEKGQIKVLPLKEAQHAQQ